MAKVIFIPGFTGGKRDMFVAKKILKKYNLIYFKYNTLLIQTIEEISKELNSFIKSLKLKENEKINLIGVSAGGIIALYYAKFLNNEKIDKFVTMHSPLKGSYFAWLFPKKLRGLKQLKKNSKFLKKLKKKKTKVNQINFWNYFDVLVPGKSGKGENPINTKMPIHFLVQWWPAIYYKIKKFFERG